MDRWDVGFVVIGLASLVALPSITDDGGVIFSSIVGCHAFVAGAIAANHSIARKPKLVVEYRNPRLGDRAVVFNSQVKGTSQSVSCQLKVYVINKGRGSAENVEVRFDVMGANDILTESGGVPLDVDRQVSPPRFVGFPRILPPKGGEWCMALIAWHRGISAPPTARWEAFARHMTPQLGEVRFEYLSEPPEELRP